MSLLWKGKCTCSYPEYPFRSYRIQDIEEREVFYVLVFGRGDSEDFRLKGYDVDARPLLSSTNPSNMCLVVHQMEKSSN